MEIEDGTNNLTAETFVIPRTRMMGVHPRLNQGAITAGCIKVNLALSQQEKFIH